MSALDRGLELLDDLPLSMRLLREVHAVLLAGVRGRDRQPGQLRTTQNWIGAPTDSLDVAVFVPPPPDALGGCLDDLERFADHQGDMPELVQCALIHYQFETIHPFLDGNGRLGRLLIVLFLVVRRRLPGPILYVSPYFEERRDEYIAACSASGRRAKSTNGSASSLPPSSIKRSTPWHEQKSWSTSENATGASSRAGRAAKHRPLSTWLLSHRC